MRHVLDRKRVLVVDDEIEICEMVADLLDNCIVDWAMTFPRANAKLQSNEYDVVILDIMGVRGHELLRRFGARVPVVMLTANALSPEDLKRAMEGEARLYLPKDELWQLDSYLARVLEEPDRSHWGWLFRTLDFRRWFGSRWWRVDLDFFGRFDFDITEEEVLDQLQAR